VLELLNWTTGHFKRAGIEEPRLNAELLLGKALSWERIRLYTGFDVVVGRQERDEFRDLVKRRAAGWPLQYLLGRCEFYGRCFEVTPAVMVPRQETELVIDKCLQKLPGNGAGSWCADIGTGSGVIAVTLAAERPSLRVIATDSSEEALKVTARNTQAHGVAGRVALARGHLTDPVPGLLPPGSGGLDLLVSNPPYIPTGDIERLPAEIRDYEPLSALDGGADGLRVIAELISQARHVLKAGGWLIVELGEGQGEAVREIAAGTGDFRRDSIEIEKDGGGCERVLAAQLSAQG